MENSAKDHNKKEQIKEIMRLHYGFDSFRPGQKDAIDNILKNRSTLLIMPTGGGKSLCYQLPALVLPGVTFVVSPLISLMKDQVDALYKIGIPATFINSSITPAETAARLESVKNGSVKILYIAPERFYSREFTDALKNIEVSLFAVDEAHCISQWGHDFRPSYTRLNEAVRIAGGPPVIALTATATPEVKEDIIKQLELSDPRVIVTGFSRPNLQFGVIQAKEHQKPGFVLDAIKSLPEESGIIYASTRNRVDNLLEILLENDIEAAAYHAGMDPEDRKWVQNNFLRGKIKVIVATNAFGLGIDKSNVRYVIHYDMPGTVEAYYQEAGRAGRDGKQSYCLLLFNSRDRILHEFFIKGDNPPPQIIHEIYEILLAYKSDTVFLTYSEISGSLSDNVPDMAIGTGLKILEKQKVISRQKEKSANAYLKTRASFSKIKSLLGQRAKKSLEIIDRLEEKYRPSLEKGLSINLQEIADIIRIKKDSLQRTVKKLSELGAMEYKPPFKGTEIRILERLKTRKLGLDEESLKLKLKKAYEKLDKMEDYVYDLGCRQKYILDYFGDYNSPDCGLCDSCLAKNGYQKPYPVSGNKIKRESAEESKRKKKNSSLNTKLTQLETLELYNKGMGLKQIALTRKLKEETIASHIVFLVEKNIMPDKEIDKLVEKNIQEKIRQAAKDEPAGKLKPIFEALEGKISYQDIKLTLAKKNQNGHKNAK